MSVPGGQEDSGREGAAESEGHAHGTGGGASPGAGLRRAGLRESTGAGPFEGCCHWPPASSVGERALGPTVSHFHFAAQIPESDEVIPTWRLRKLFIREKFQQVEKTEGADPTAAHFGHIASPVAGVMGTSPPRPPDDLSRHGDLIPPNTAASSPPQTNSDVQVASELVARGCLKK